MRFFRSICYYYIIMSEGLPNFLRQFIHSCPPKLWRAGLDLLFPRHCFGCGREKTWLCDRGLANLPRSWLPREAGIFSVFEYDSPITKQVIWRLKYKRSLELAETLARPMHDVLLEELQDELLLFSPPDLKGALPVRQAGRGVASVRSETSHKIILIPTPLSPSRRRFRGYNQAEELAKQISRLNPDQFAVRTDLVKKVKNTPTQVTIRNREQRLSNLKNAFALTASCEVAFRAHLKNDLSQGSPAEKKNWPFAVSKSNFKGLRSSTSISAGQFPATNQIFVIIDDVSTTGATINEIRNLLTLAGARHVYGLVVAHG